MPKKRDLIEKLCRKPIPRNFSKRELDILMGKCDCKKFQGGRGSGIGFVHSETKRILQFDEPHPGNELKRYQIKQIRDVLQKEGLL